MPVVGRGERCHNEISLARAGWRSRRRDRGLDAFVKWGDRRRPLHGAWVLRRCRRARSFFTRTLFARALFGATRRQRTVQARRRRRLGRRRGRRGWRLLGTHADARRQVDGGLLVLLVLFVLLRHP